MFSTKLGVLENLEKVDHSGDDRKKLGMCGLEWQQSAFQRAAFKVCRLILIYQLVILAKALDMH